MYKVRELFKNILMTSRICRWRETRVSWLKRVLSYCGYRSKRLGSAEFQHYRPGLIYLALIHGLYTVVFKVRLLLEGLCLARRVCQSGRYALIIYFIIRRMFQLRASGPRCWQTTFGRTTRR